MKRAFTLVELLIVIIIVSVLAAIAIPKVVQNGRRSEDASLRSNLRILRVAVDRFYADTGYYPQRMSWLNDRPDEVMPTFPVITEAGVEVTISGTIYKGPYVTDDSGNALCLSQPNPRGGTYNHASPGLLVPVDPVSGLPYKCALVNGKFLITSSATGKDSTGVPYSSY
ncbi:MAG: prepilin-type N-terminal cleavage/methylation domain-containing protein [Armatimonadota bacterium]